MLTGTASHGRSPLLWFLLWGAAAGCYAWLGCRAWRAVNPRRAAELDGGLAHEHPPLAVLRARAGRRPGRAV